MARKKHSRNIATAAIFLLLGAGLAVAFWPRPLLVDFGTVTRGSMQVTIDEEGRTRVKNSYVLSTPVAGRLLRVNVLPGDPVVQGETVVAQMRPINPAALDVRTREQANASVSAAEAALRVAKADLNAATADSDLARSDYERMVRLFERDTISEAALERSQSQARSAEARMDTTAAAIAMREAELENARALLIGFDESTALAYTGESSAPPIPLFAPVSGRILHVIQQSETTLPVGTPVMEIGNVRTDLEVVVQLISSDAVQVSVGDLVMIDDWGGSEALDGVIRRIEPFGITKYSTLGVEEQRVDVVVDFTGSPATRSALGHGYRVEARIIVWDNPNTLIVPASALFRVGDSWSVFTLEDGRAVLQDVDIGRNNGIEAQVMNGLEEGAPVVLYPSAAIDDGARVAAR